MRSKSLVCALAALASLLATWPVAGQPPPLPSPSDAAGRLADLAFQGTGLTPNPCPGAIETHVYDVVAIRIPISYNHWGDFDPEGRLLVLRDQLDELVVQVATQLANAGHATGARVLARLQSNPTDPLGALAELGVDLTVDPNAPEPVTFDTSRAPRLDPIDVSSMVQPFIVRVHLGDCVELRLLNALPEPVSLHIHAARTRPGQGMAFGTNLPDLTLPGETRSYVAYFPPLAAMEGAHLLHSHADERFHTKHGLFGAVVVEPAGSVWRDPTTLSLLSSGQDAVIDQPDPLSDFREYVLIYHDEVELLDRSLKRLPVVSSYGEYGPGTKAINLRSEPFMDRFQHHDALFALNQVDHGFDKSQGYSSYTYGDPATFVPRAYVGDPSKFRLVNVGPGQHHVHHLHGGGDRWRTSSVSEDTQFDDGLIKTPPEDKVQSASERIDVQSMGPGESFNAEIEGGAGGVQQSVGDFLFHCHIVEHYVGGMWSFWRVYNTLQLDLAPLPDRNNASAPVDSIRLHQLWSLLGSLPDGRIFNETNFRTWIEDQLPPRGEPGDYDAAVWNWKVDDVDGRPRYLGEPETGLRWPNYHGPDPWVILYDGRPELEFHPITGRLAYPFLRPHFGERPPFAPSHGPAPYLGLEVGPGRPDGLCPPSARHLDYRVVAINTTVEYNDYGDEDPAGQVFVHAEEKQQVLDREKPAKNLILRANQGDCVDILFTSQLAEDPAEHFSKVNMHIHLVQFDVQGSDGVITGLNYETSVRPAPSTSTTLRSARAAGSMELDVQDTANLHEGASIGVGLTTDRVEVHVIDQVLDEHTLRLRTALTGNHTPGEWVGHEFVRYRWYPDVELGMVYWHDHVDGLNSWRHGLFGGLVVEPQESRWLDPKRAVANPTDPANARDVPSGTLVDILGSRGRYREFVVEVQDRSGCIPRPDPAFCENEDLNQPPDVDQVLASFNLRSEPLHRRDTRLPLRNANNGDHDPATEVWETFAGDPVVIRLLYAGQSTSAGVGTFAVSGHRFPFEQHNPGSRTMDALSLGISSQHNLRLECGAGSCGQLPGDYLYSMTQPDLLSRGAWGIFRVHPAGDSTTNLQPLWGHSPDPPVLPPADPSKVRSYHIVALEADISVTPSSLPEEISELLPDNPDLAPVESLRRPVQLFALEEEVARIREGTLTPMPLVLRAQPEEIIEIHLRNDLDHPVTLHAGQVLPLSMHDLGIPVGRSPSTPLVPPNETRTYRWHIDRELGALRLASFAQPARDSLEGLYGALVVEPEGSDWLDPATGKRVLNGMTADLLLKNQSRVREHVLLYASDDPIFETSVMPYAVDVQGPVSVNYRAESLHNRVGGQHSLPTANDPVGGRGVHACQFDNATCKWDFPFQEVRNPVNALAFRSPIHGDPATPILTVKAGEPFVLRALSGAGDQLQVHALASHWWARDSDLAGSDLVDAQTLGPGEALNAWMVADASGGDYLWGTHRSAFQESGAWGILRVSAPPLLPLPDPAPALALAEEVRCLGPLQTLSPLAVPGTPLNEGGGDADVLLGPFAFLTNFQPGCVTIGVPGTLEFLHQDLEPHNPISGVPQDPTSAPGECFNFEADRGHSMQGDDAYRLTFTQDDLDRLLVSPDGGPKRECQGATASGSDFIVPYYCSLHENMQGQIVVRPDPQE